MVLDKKEQKLVEYFVKFVILPVCVIFTFLRSLRPKLVLGGSRAALLGQIGALTIGIVLYKVGRLLYDEFGRKAKNVRDYGKWAVVTGATNGIGETYCHELASRGLSILLISRNEDKLKKTSKDILEKYPNVKTDYLIRDFADAKEASVNKFLSSLTSKLTEISKDGGIGMLINSVGLANDLPTVVHELDPENVRQMLYVNNDGTMMMTQAVLPFMVDRRSGAIIIVSSASGRAHATPMLSVYSATKAFGNQLARSMFYEYKGYGIDCLGITPYYFISGMYRPKKPSMLAPFPDKIVNRSLKLLGHVGESWGHLPHSFNVVIQAFMPHDIGDKMMFIMSNNRARMLQRMAAKKL